MPKPETAEDLGAQILSGKYTITVIKELLKAPNTRSGIAIKLGLSQAAVRYTVNRLEKHGLLEVKLIFGKHRAAVRQYSIVRPAFQKALRNIEKAIKDLRG